VGRPLPAEARAVLSGVRQDLDGKLGSNLAAVLTAGEIVATAARIDRLLDTDVFPEPVRGWPAVPWPPL
jgi:hypothetical protein